MSTAQTSNANQLSRTEIENAFNAALLKYNGTVASYMSLHEMARLVRGAYSSNIVRIDSDGELFCLGKKVEAEWSPLGDMAEWKRWNGLHSMMFRHFVEVKTNYPQGDFENVAYEIPVIVEFSGTEEYDEADYMNVRKIGTRYEIYAVYGPDGRKMHPTEYDEDSIQNVVNDLAQFVINLYPVSKIYG